VIESSAEPPSPSPLLSAELHTRIYLPITFRVGFTSTIRLVGRTGPSQVQGPRDVIVANSSTTLWGVHEMARPEGAKSETRRAESRGVLGEDMLPSLPDRDSGEGCKLPSRVRGESQAIWRFRIFMGSQISRFWCQFC